MQSRLLRGLGLLAYAVLILLVFGLAAYTSFSLFVRSGVTTVPSVIGLSRADAVAALADQGLTVRNAEGGERYDDKIPAGRVARQSPDPRVLMKRGRPVVIVLSKGPRRVQVPDLLGRPSVVRGMLAPTPANPASAEPGSKDTMAPPGRWRLGCLIRLACCRT